MLNYKFTFEYAYLYYSKLKIMKTRILFLLSFLFFIYTDTAKAQEKFNEIDATQLSVLMAEKSVLILDTRTEQEYNSGHIPGAININYYDENAAKKMLELDKNAPVYVYCQAGGRARKACDFLVNSGFKNVYHLSGDIIGWEKAGKEIEKTSNE